jgi:BMFP domain-containing protein YqiC
MSSSTSRIFDDLGRLMTDAAGVASGVRREIDSIVKSQIERLLRDADVVTREEFEAVREMAVLAREENEALKARISVLEDRLGGETHEPTKPRKAAKT